MRFFQKARDITIKLIYEMDVAKQKNKINSLGHKVKIVHSSSIALHNFHKITWHRAAIEVNKRNVVEFPQPTRIRQFQPKTGANLQKR